MTSFLRVSKALDSGNLPEICLAVGELPEDLKVEEYQTSILSILMRLSTMDLDGKDEEQYNISLDILIQKITQSNVEEYCLRFLDPISPIFARVIGETILRSNIILSNKNREKVINYLSKCSINQQNFENWLNTIAVYTKVLEKSGTSFETRKIIMDSAAETAISASIVDINRGLITLPDVFLVEFWKYSPMHPISELKGLLPDRGIVLNPEVLSLSYKSEIGLKSFNECSASTSVYKQIDPKLIFKILKLNCERFSYLDFRSEHVSEIAEFWKTGFIVFQNLQGPEAQELVPLFAKTVHSFPDELKPLFLKRILHLLNENENNELINEPQIVAVIIDHYQTNLKHKEFQNELGEFYSIAYSLKYSNIYNATCYYTALFALARSQALLKIKSAMAAEVLKTILKPIHEQIVDFKRLKSSKEDKKATEIEEYDNLGSEMFDFVIYSLENAINSIENFISC